MGTLSKGFYVWMVLQRLTILVDNVQIDGLHWSHSTAWNQRISRLKEAYNQLFHLILGGTAAMDWLHVQAI